MSHCEVRGNTIVCHRGQQMSLRSCEADKECQRQATQLCDYELQPDQTCDTAMCKFHTYSTLKADLCPKHRPADA